jgi:exodeoxyribonuclease VII large subunit
VIRGGGAVNDLAWLNDYALARWICECPVPVHTGIGHERDETVLDEVAHTRFDTPSKVIAGIEAVMRRRTTEAHTLSEAVRREAARLLHEARRRAQGQVEAVRHGAHRRLRQASERSDALLHEVRHRAAGGLATARRALPLHLADVRAESRRGLAAATTGALAWRDSIARHARDEVRHSHETSIRHMVAIGRDARRAVVQARSAGDALVREISGQGPERTLARGFALVRAGGDPVTAAQALRAVPAGTPVEIQFHDGTVPIDPPRSPR